MTKGKTPISNSALAKFGSLPRVGNGFGYDIGLSFSHRYALEMAADILSELKKGERGEVFTEIYNVFEQWKNEHGVYPPPSIRRSFLLGLSDNDDQKPEPARKYIKRQMLAAELAGKKHPKHIEAWECDSFAKTPVRLFFKLLSEDYLPLSAPADRLKSWRYDYILAAVIIMSNNPESEYQSGDCIEGALKLAESRLGIQKDLIERMTPLAQETFNRKRQARLKREAAKEETERKVIELHQRFMKEGNVPPYKEYATILGYSESTISRILKKNGFSKYKS